MKLTFYGAAKAVTGSCHCLEACGKKILVDCGLQQGKDEIDNTVLPFRPGDIDMVFVTHAHIDHSGRLPLLAKMGFTGNIYCTRLTGQLMSIMLRDSAHIQESDAAWLNQKGKRAGKDLIEPLYTLEDVDNMMQYVQMYEYNDIIEIFPGLKVRFTDAGHLLGSSYIEMWITEDGKETKIVFSGDIGNKNQPIICDPSKVAHADYVVMESTYGNRNHENLTFDYTNDLAKIIDSTLAEGGNVIIPSFAVGRTQELLFFIREMKEQGLVQSNPNFRVCLDSPLAEEATKIFSGDLTGYIDDAAKALVKDGVRMFTFPGLELSPTAETSKLLNEDPEPKVIISASGMCDAGRIRHHLKHNLWKEENTIVFVGYQAAGSLGRIILDGAKTVKLFGEEIAVKANIVRFHGLSSHADHDGLIEWISAFEEKPKHVFVVHGSDEAAPAFVADLRDLGFEAHAPDYLEEYDLEGNVRIREGIMPVRKKKVAGKDSPAFLRLLSMGNQLIEVIHHNRGGTNKDLAKFADQIKALIDKWDR
ncbi:MAG: MBL fold metallo-hydrolase [Clostridiales bacterium]|nr:MBL fold metallo-hydrolase [Clostridiales bacterium]